MVECNECNFIKQLTPSDLGIYFSESENFIAYISQEQVSDFHLIVQPKRHILRMTELEPEEWKEFGEFSRKITGSTFYYANSHLLAVNGMLEPKQEHFKFHLITSVPKQLEIPWEPQPVSEEQHKINKLIIEESRNHFPENRTIIQISPDQPIHKKFKFEDFNAGFFCLYHGIRGHVCEFNPKKDGIPAIDYPEFKTTKEISYLHKGDLLALVEINGSKRAYSLRVLVSHEIVNDVLGDVSIAITYCPLCESVTVFNRVVEGEKLSFGVSGYLLNSDVLMYDRKTESLWSQIESKCVYGKLMGKDLELLPFQMIEWSSLKLHYPDIEVLTDNTGYHRDYQREAYDDYKKTEKIMFPVNKEDKGGKLPNKEIIYAIEMNGIVKAYPEKIIKEKRVIIDQVGNEKILIILGSDGGIRSYSGDIPASMNISGSKFIDESGSVWNDRGECIDGTRNTQKLNQRNDFIRMFYFAWVAFNPQTDINIFS